MNSEFDCFQDIEVHVSDGFYTGIVYYNIETEDNSFDYEYGSIKGTHKVVNKYIGEWDISNLKYYDYETDTLMERNPSEEDIKEIENKLKKYV